MKPKVVIAYTGFGDIELEKKVLSPLNAEIIHSENLRTPAALEAVKDADAVIVTLERVTAEIINSMTRCKIISRSGTGLDTIDIPAATARVNSGAHCREAGSATLAHVKTNVAGPASSYIY